VTHLDRVVFVADRMAVLTALALPPSGSSSQKDHHGLAARATAWRAAGMLITGPVVARGDFTAQALIYALATRAPETVRLELTASHVMGADLAYWLACGRSVVPM